MEADADGAVVAAGAAATNDAAPAFEHNDAYAQHFKAVLQTVVTERPDWRKLLSQQELALAMTFLHELAPIEQQLYARLFQRKGPWFKTTALFRYFTQKPYVPAPTPTGAADGADDAAVETAEDASVTGTNDEGNDANEDGDVVLLAGNGATPATNEATVDTATTAGAQELPDNSVVQTALQSLLRHGFFETLTVQSAAVASIATSSASVTSTHSDAALAQALNALQHCATAPEVASLQKLLTGSRATKKTTTAKQQRASPTSANTASSSSSKVDALDAIRSVVLTQRRIDGSRIPLARLLHRVFFESYPLAGKSVAQDVFVVHLSATARDLFDRMHRLVYFQASLPFSTSAAVLAPQPTCDAFAAAAARILEDATQWPGLMVRFRKVAYPTYAITIVHDVFPSSAAYMCYEVARQLHAILLMVEPALAVASAGDNAAQSQDLEPKWIAFDEPPELVAFQKLMETDDDGFELLSFDTSDAGAPAVVDWQIESWRQFRALLRTRLTTLDAFCLEARRCFHAFGAWTAAQARVAMTPAPPPFFAKCSAGYHLARVLHHAVALYEKQRQYQVAVLLLNDLLAVPFLQRKRGHWWERLALNLEHLACRDQARMTCVNALDDADVVGADRVALMRRLRRLQKRSGAETSALPQQPSATDRDLDDFESLVSDDDDADRSSLGNAAATTNDAIATPLDEYAYRREHIVGRPLNRQTAEKSRFIGYDDEPCTVEQLVLQYYRSQRKTPDDPGTDNSARERGGWYGVHCEGRVLGNLFGVCMWDVLYASVPDVFQTPFQAAPLDFGDATSFVRARRELIDAKLAKLRHEWSVAELLDDIATTWHREFGKVSRFVSWPDARALPLAFHQLVAMAMGPARLANLMEYMLTSPEYHRAQNGLPDLLLLRGTRVPREDDDDSEPQQRLPVDSDHGCLDIFALCRMDCHMNLNDRTADDAMEHRDDEPSDGAESSEAPSLVEQLRGWSLELKLVEVKGPRDRLSDKQTLWLQVLDDGVGIDAAVTHVVEDAKTLEKKRLSKNPKPKNPKPKDPKNPNKQSLKSSSKRSAKRQKK